MNAKELVDALVESEKREAVPTIYVYVPKDGYMEYNNVGEINVNLILIEWELWNEHFDEAMKEEGLDMDLLSYEDNAAIREAVENLAMKGLTTDELKDAVKMARMILE